MFFGNCWTCNLLALLRTSLTPDVSCTLSLPASAPPQLNSTPATSFTRLYRFFSQFHYDWGLRAVKSVLLVAGKLKRCDPDIDEEAVLMRALRDFNTPKIVSADTPIFLRLIADLFPSMDLAPKARNRVQRLRCGRIYFRFLIPSGLCWKVYVVGAIDDWMWNSQYSTC